MSFRFSIPRTGESPLDITVNAGDAIYLLGANGTGKSSLMAHLYRDHSANALRITAHRQMWFPSNSVMLSPTERRNSEATLRQYYSRPESRWTDFDPGTSPRAAIYDLVDAENVRARAIAGAVDSNDLKRVESLRVQDAPLKIINELLENSNIPVTISINDGSDVVAMKHNGAPYSIAQLSDGERSAILIACNVLTAKQGSLILVDEPERHLHRSIISPLLNLLFGKRVDCAFVVSTHDVMLPLDHPSAKTLLVRGCAYRDSSVATRASNPS